MDLKQIELFLKVAEKKSFTRAAEELFVTQQLVSKRISELEKELGVSLFERTTKMVKLTEIGQLAYYKLSRNMLMMRQSIAELKEYSIADMPKLRLGIYRGVRKAVSASVLEQIYTQVSAGDVELVIVEHVGDTKALDAGKQDLFFTFIDDVEKWEEYGCLPVKDSRHQAIVSCQHPWCAKGPISRADARKEVFHRVVVQAGTIGSNIYVQMPGRLCIEHENIHTVLAMVEMNRGFTILPADEELLHHYQVAAVELGFSVQHIRIVGLYQKDNQNPALKRILAQEI